VTDSPPNSSPSLSRNVSTDRIGRWLPGFAIFRTYKLSSFLKDLTAGFVLTAVLVPAGKGYAQASGLPPIYGLYATVVPLLAYAIFGPSRILVLSPDSSLAAFIAATILPLAAGNAERTLVLAGMLAILSSVIC